MTREEEIREAHHAHIRCLDAWADLPPRQRKRTTLHGWEDHLAPEASEAPFSPA